MSRVAAIHQPNFFPWLGYFDKIARCDVFVVLDDAQHQKTGGTWTNRVRLLVGGEPRWATAPLSRPPHGSALLAQIEWAPQPWREKLQRSIEMNYRRAPHYREAMDLIGPLVCHPEPGVARYNLHAILTIAAALGVAPHWCLSSEFALQAVGTARLVELVRAAACDTYLAGGGAQGYQEDDAFGAAGLTLQYQSFDHPTYLQHGCASFTPGLSIIDALMNCGIEGTRRLLGRA